MARRFLPDSCWTVIGQLGSLKVNGDRHVDEVRLHFHPLPLAFRDEGHVLPVMAELHDRRELALAGRDFLVGWEAVSEAFLEHEEQFLGVRPAIVALATDDDFLDAGVEDIRVESRLLATAVLRRRLAEGLEFCDGVGFG